MHEDALTRTRSVGAHRPTRTREAPRARRTRRHRRFLMAAPDHVAVTYAINPWMDPRAPFDPERAAAQWRTLLATYRTLGHHVDVLPAAPGLPDLVFAANGAFVVGRTALLSRFRHEERRGEEALHEAWLRDRGFSVTQAAVPLEGEGDLLVVGRTVLAGAGPRTDPRAHREVAAMSGREVVSLVLTDPRYYHLDTVVGVLDDRTVAWFPPALDVASQERLRRRFPTAVEVDEEDAALLGCNLVSDGRTVVVPAGVGRLARDLARRGHEVVEVDTSELLLAGGGPKCCTAEHHPA